MARSGGAGVILVTGATGQQGGAVARELLAQRRTVRAMTRKPDSEAAKALATLGAEILKGNLNDPESLKRVVQGVWGVFAVQNAWEAGVEAEEAQGKRIAEIARQGGVQHFVYTSVGSANRKTGIPHFDSKWRIEETVRGLGFPSHVIIRPVFFMENFLSPWLKPGIDQGKLQMALKATTVLQMVAVRDVGKHGARAFEQHAELNRKEIDIAGDAHTMADTAKILSQAAGRTITFEPVPLDIVRAFSEDYAAMLEWFDRVGYDVDSKRLAAQSGIKPATLADWAATSFVA